MHITIWELNKTTTDLLNKKNVNTNQITKTNKIYR